LQGIFLLIARRCVRDGLQEGEAFGEGADCLLMRLPLQGHLAYLLQIARRTHSVLPALKVHRQRHRDRTGPLTIAHLFPRPNGPMQARPLPSAEALVQHGLIQGMPKSVLPTHRPIRPCHQPLVIDELPPPR
jgi:hypothetical protein